MTQSEYIDYLNKIIKQINASIIPVISSQQQLVNQIESFYSSIATINKYYKTIDTIYKLQISDNVFAAMQVHEQIIKNLSNLHFDISTAQLSFQSSAAISQISSDAINELDTDYLSEDLIESKDTISKISHSKIPLTWEQVISIITLIITILMFIQAQKPNEQLTHIENSLQQLIEIESKELNTFEELSE